MIKLFKSMFFCLFFDCSFSLFQPSHDCSISNSLYEKTVTSQVIFSGTVRGFKYDLNGSIKKAKVEIKRVFKNNKKFKLILLMDYHGKIFPAKNKIIQIFSENNACFDNIKLFDTWIFFGKATNSHFFLTDKPSIFSLPNIDSLEEIIKENRVNEFEKRDEALECGPTSCQYGAKCEFDPLAKKKVCVCHHKCPFYQKEVCGSDGVTYPNECLLLKTSCDARINISLVKQTPCDDPCFAYPCSFGATCMINKEGRAFCECPLKHQCVLGEQSTSSLRAYDHAKEKILCGENKKNYMSVCDLQVDECLLETTIRIKSYTACDSKKCGGVSCLYNSICLENENEETPKCLCVFTCSQLKDEVCGSDGKTYLNECLMEREECLIKTKISKFHQGSCEKIMKKKMNKQEKKIKKKEEQEKDCFYDVCSCASTCEDERHNFLCGSDSNTHTNQCFMWKSSCSKRIKISVIHEGKCQSEINDEIKCSGKSCLFGSTCVKEGYGKENRERCICNFECPNDRQQVCGSDGIFYKNFCLLKRASCLKQQFLNQVPNLYCKNENNSSESFCDSDNILRDTLGREYECNEKNNYEQSERKDQKGVKGKSRVAKKKICPPDSFCHYENGQGKCCKKKQDKCKCHAFGSKNPLCDISTGLCDCKLHVAGFKCDRCEAGFWGFQDIKQSSGCKDCKCNLFNSISKSCDTKTGKCLCKRGYYGDKCDLCFDKSCFIDEDSKQNYDKWKIKENKIFENEKNRQKLKEAKLNITYDHFNSHHFKPSNEFEIPRFSGNSFLELTPFHYGESEINITMRLNVSSEEGLLFFCESTVEQGDENKKSYLLIFFKNGNIEFKFDLGSGPALLRLEVGSFDFPMTISALRSGRDGLLVGEDVETIGVSGGRSRVARGKPSPVYIGFVPDKYSNVLVRHQIKRGFIGCIESLIIQSSNHIHKYHLSTKGSFTDVLSQQKIENCK